MITTSSGLRLRDVRCGTGAAAERGDRVTVHYRGALVTGPEIDSSRAHGGAFSFALGLGQVIAGWDEGIAGMRVGGERKLVVPPGLAFGDGRAHGVPPHATLTFDIVLVDVVPGDQG